MKTKTKLSKEWIYKFYRDLDMHGIDHHALILVRDGEVLFENYVYPYSADMPHTLFSVTKSIVATAAGFAIDEGLLSLDTKIIDIFPEYKAIESPEWDNVTLRSVLTMSSNKEFSFTQDMTGDYVEMFMSAPFRGEKDRGFLYSNNDAHMVAASVQKRAGMNLVDYLTPRLFEPLGIDVPFWETNDLGENIGGNGCYLKLRDLVKICQCYADGGRMNGKQILPEWWTKEATKFQVKTGSSDVNGYGYLFWIFGENFSMDGMFGQRVSYFPKYNAIMAGFNACVNDSDFTKAFDNILPMAFEPGGDESYDKKLDEYLIKKDHKPIACDRLPKIPTGKMFYLTDASDKIANLVFPASIIPRSITSSFAKRSKTNLNCLSFEVTENVLTVKWMEEEDEVVINCGLDGEARMSECTLKGYPYKIWAYAYINNGKLTAVVKPINTLATQYIEFDFADNQVSLKFTSTPCFVEFITRNCDQQHLIAKSGALKPAIHAVVEKVMQTTQLPMKFKTK